MYSQAFLRVGGVCVSACMHMRVFFIWDYGTRAHHFSPS